MTSDASKIWRDTASLTSSATRTPAPEGEADFNSHLIEDRLEMAARASASSMFICELMDEAAEKIKELRTPAPEGEAVAWRCSGRGRLTDDLDADHASLDAGGFLSCCPERDMKPLYASPVVPVGSREEAVVASVTLEGRQGEPAGMMTVTLHMSDGSEVPIIRDNGNVISHWARVGAAVQQAALRPTDTGWRDIATAPKDGTKIDLWVTFEKGSRRAASAYWDTKSEDWMLDQWFLHQYAVEPVLHAWMPLPPAPTDTGRE